MARIEGIRIQNFRCLKDISLGRTSENLDATPLSPLTVVIGKNGVGKSTLFDAFGFLADALRYGVEEACDKRGGFKQVLSQGQTKLIRFEVLYRENSLMLYIVTIKTDETNRPFISDERLIRESTPSHSLFLFSTLGMAFTTNDQNGFDAKEFIEKIEIMSLSYSSKNSWPALLTQFVKEQLPSVECIELTDNKKLAIATLGSLKKHSEITAFRQFLESWYLSYFTPNAFREINSKGTQSHFDKEGSNIANVVEFMEKNHPDKIQSILDSIAEKIPGIDTIKTYRDPINTNLYLLFNDKGFAKPFSQLQMSDGTLKLFAYLLLLADPNPPPFICIEEPENGLYHKLLEVLASEFRRHASEENKTQLFITTHQPYFVDGLNPREVWILEKGEDGFSTIRRASDDELVNNLFEEEMPLGGLWYSGYLDKRAKPCTLKS